MSGEIKRAEMNSQPTSLPLERKLANDRMSPTSPLKLFGHAKKKINDIFNDILAYINEGDVFINELESEHTGLIKHEQIELFKKYQNKLAGIQEILKRDCMKVAFFGRTSNGKSTVINAMLRNRILPSGIGHTTNCFLQVEGSDGQEAYLITEQAPNEKMSLQSISQLANALSNVKLNNDTLIRICWPKDMCSLLKDDVVLVDSPGIDVSPDLDGWIDRFCLDADVFVLVVNAESTLMQTEKNFFHRVSERLSKPNIFILNNRWDASVSEVETMQEVRQQHLERSIHFLVNELKVTNQSEAENRVFFVSAREALVSRLNQDKGTPTPSGQMLDGFQGRLFEFATFERKFEECISHSAMETKFAQHTANGKEITREMFTLMDRICLAAVNERVKKIEEYESKSKNLKFTNKQIDVSTFDIKEQIKQMAEDVERKVSLVLFEEIKRLSALVDEYNHPFESDQTVLNKYKKDLHTHVEDCLGRNLQSRCSAAFKSTVDDVTFYMTDKMMELIPLEQRGKAQSVLPNQSFELNCRLDCRNLCSEFVEDIEFRFSLGIVTLIQRFTRGKKSSSSSPKASLFPGELPVQRGGPDGEFVVSILSNFSTLYSGTTIGILAIVFLLGRAAGWRIIGACSAIYGSLYLYEWLTWTNGAKEKAFKRQYVDYATSKLRLIIDLTSANCSYQVQQELNSRFSYLCQQVDLTRSQLEIEIRDLTNYINKLENASKQANYLKNKAQFVDAEINNFVSVFLKA